jgi:hypothetical protein
MSARRHRTSESEGIVHQCGPGISFRLDAQGILRTVMRGVIRLDDVLAYARARESAGLLDRPQVIDAAEARLDISSADVRTFADLARTTRQRAAVGRTAFVASQDFAYALGRMYSAFSGSDSHDFAVFRSMAEADAWIEETK